MLKRFFWKIFELYKPHYMAAGGFSSIEEWRWRSERGLQNVHV